MRTVQVLTLAPSLHLGVLDGVLSAVEIALLQLGASKVWVAADQPMLTVMADLPEEVLAAPWHCCEDGTE